MCVPDWRTEADLMELYQHVVAQLVQCNTKLQEKSPLLEKIPQYEECKEKKQRAVYKRRLLP